MRDVSNLKQDIIDAFRRTGITPVKGSFGSLVVRDGKFALAPGETCGCAVTALVLGEPAPAGLPEMPASLSNSEHNQYVGDVVDEAVALVNERYGIPNSTYFRSELWEGFDADTEPASMYQVRHTAWQAAQELGAKRLEELAEEDA